MFEKINTLNIQIDMRNSLTQFIGSLDCIFSSIFWNHMADVQGYVTKIVRGMETRREFKWFIVMEELDFQFGIVHRFYLALKMGCFSFSYFSRALWKLTTKIFYNPIREFVKKETSKKIYPEIC